MALDLETLLAPISDEAPSGPDLGYEPERQEIEQAFESSISIDSSGEEAGGPEIDWRPVLKGIESESAKSKDVWLAVYLCRAGARMGDLETIETGAEFLAGLFERFWDTVHPQLEEYGVQGRKGPCDSLARIAEFIGPLKRAALLKHPRLGIYSGADFERFRANGDAEDGYGMFRAALEETPPEALDEIVARLDAIAGAIRRADGVLTANSEGGGATNFQPTYDALAEIKRAVASFGSNPAEAAPETESEEVSSSDAGGGSGGSGGGPRIAGRVESREDVLKALDAIGDYYRRKEPASPVPLVLQRAREWVNLDFLTVLEDIAPGSLDEARKVLISQRGKESSGSSW